MAYLLANLGRRYTQSRSITVLVSSTSATLTTPPITMEFREVGYSWTPAQTFSPYKRLELSEELGDKTIECRLTDAIANTITLSQIVTLVVDVDPYAPWFPETQIVGNNLPQWHPGRRLRSSNWQRFMNVISPALHMTMTSADDAADAIFLDTTPLDEIDLVGRCWPDITKLNVSKVDTNLLDNPSLGLAYQPFGEPQGWALANLDATWVLDRTDYLFGWSSLRTAPASGDHSTLTQDVEITLTPGETLIAGVYYKNPNVVVPTAVPATTDYHLRLVVLYEDGTTDVATTTLNPETQDNWAYASAQITATDYVTRAWFIIHVDHITALGAFNTYVGGCTLYKDREKPFSFGNTKPWWIENPSTISIEPSSELWFTDSPQEFWSRAIPTRMGTAVNTGDVGPFAAETVASPSFIIQNALRESFNIGYIAQNNKVAMYETTSQSLIKEYNVAIYDAGLDGFLEVEDFYISAVTYFRDRLWAIGYFNDTTALNITHGIRSDATLGAPVDGGTRTAYLCLLQHLTPATETSYMEVIAMLPLKNFTAVSPLIDMGFDNDDPHWVFYRTTASEFYSRLYYDYGMPRNDGSVWLREPASNVSLT